MYWYVKVDKILSLIISGLLQCLAGSMNHLREKNKRLATDFRLATRKVLSNCSTILCSVYMKTHHCIITMVVRDVLALMMSNRNYVVALCSFIREGRDYVIESNAVRVPFNHRDPIDVEVTFIVDGIAL